MRFLFAFVLAATLAGCTTTASGPSFSQQIQPSAPAGYIRVFVYRDNVFYLVQAPYVVRADITIDGRLVGSLANGGYLLTTVTLGHHVVTAGSGQYQTTQAFDARSAGDGYIEVADKSRMEGARIVGEAALGAANSLSESALNGDDWKTARGSAYSAAANSAAQDEMFSNSPERIWDVAFPSPQEALSKLQQLSLSTQ
jgi:hypothetical protein